tara:strand:+ start:7472 stop:8812 length:1341 start_codon:yes stop_codon:yes gene_type:complete
MTKKASLKILFAAIVGCFSSGEAVAAAGEVKAEGFFEADSDFGASLPADKIYPMGSEFLFTFFSIGGGTPDDMEAFFPEEEYQAYLKEFKDAGFTVIGPGYELDPRLLQDAEDHDMKLLYSVGLQMNFHSKEPRVLSSEEIKEQVGEQVKAVADNDRIAIWYLKPEELRHWRKNEMEYLKAATEAIRENDPQGRPIWFYEPNHRSAKSLSATSQYTDVIGKGMYTNGAGKHHERVWNRWSMDQEKLAEETIGRDLLVLSMPGMYRQPAEEDLELIPAWVTYDVFGSMVDGAEGIVVFSLRRRPNFDAVDQYYDTYKELAPIVLGEDGLGQVFLFGVDRDDLAVDIVSGPETAVLESYRGARVTEPIEYPSITIANKVYKGKRYVVLVNSANESIDAVLSGLPYMQIEVDELLDDAESYRVFEGDIHLTLPPYGVKIYEMAPADASL